ncbi:hypothetical protein AbraIFM66951_001690 [Aspergillus brasiliensis]|uniref:Uncharacterized protein n=1 Tax=Aspergillus brasiliensis TaxID=319629 RepID=A0A9W5Z3B8_9EURO|nr:hypothetical protein AbraCBS73388_006840 [Aspergillus brasiliensis]GKZ49286.1 hypothetical protein AbraIFM66951_001690 [Aspergillus brasiliensis]
MARLSLSIFVLCLFLALMVTAMPVKRDDSNGNEIDGSLAEQVAEQSLESASKMLDQIDNEEKQKQQDADNNSKTPSATSSKPSASKTTPQAEKKVADTEPSASTPSSTAENTASTPSSAPSSSSSHIVNDNPLSKVPLVGELLSGGGSGSLTGGLLG